MSEAPAQKTAGTWQGCDVMLEGVFDTGLADAVALGKSSGSNHGLGVVLADWLGADVVRLTSTLMYYN